MSKRTAKLVATLAALSLGTEAFGLDCSQNNNQAYCNNLANYASQQLAKSACSGSNDYAYCTVEGDYAVPVCDPQKLANDAIKARDLPNEFSAISGDGADNSTVNLPAGKIKNCYSLTDWVSSNPGSLGESDNALCNVGTQLTPTYIFRKNSSCN